MKLLLIFAVLLLSDACCIGNMGTLTDRGSFRCPVYTDNLNCTWLLISSKPTNYLRFNFHAYDVNTEGTPDFLKVFDGPLISYPLLGNFFGGPVHNTDMITSDSRVLLVQFRSDGSRSGGGFAFDFRIDQCLQTTEYNGIQGLLTDGSGPIGRYRNTSCTYSIKPPNVDQITLYFENLQLSDLNDTITIRDNGALIASINGSGVRKPIVASSSAEVYFQSKKDTSKLSNTPNGFALRYTAGFCAPYVDIDVNEIEISDGSGKRNYRDNVYCEWLITPKPQKPITFFPYILKSAERSDMLTVYDGFSSKSPVLAQYFGMNQMDPVYSTTNSMFVTWKTDGSRNDFGFIASIISGGCLPWVNFTSQSGGFSDGGGGVVRNNVCVWSIVPNTKVNSMITLYFRNLGLGSGSIEVYDGSDISGPVLTRITQSASFFNDSIAPIASSGNALTFVLKNAEGGTGFDADFSAGRCLTFVTLYDTVGELSDGSGDANYADSTRCGWLIRPIQNITRIELSFDGNTAESADNIRIFDGPTDKFPLLKTLSGSFGPQTILSNQGTVFVAWTSDGSKNSQGWRAKYQGL